MGNRKLPFGYIMRFGESELQPEEAACVRMIFDQYQNGASFKELAALMQDQGIPYVEGKLWNKNMIARILEDKRYTGQAPYPPIITEEQFEAVEATRSAKQVKTEKAATQKLLRKLCGTKITPRLEHQVQYLMNRLIEKPELVHSPVKPSLPNSEAAILRKKLDNVLAKQPIEEDTARQWIFELASAEYASISSAEYESERIQRLLLGAELMDELNEELIQKCVSKVLISDDGAVSLKLKNDQLIEGSMFQ